MRSFRSFADGSRLLPAPQLGIALLLAVTGFIVQLHNGSTASGMDFWRPWAVNQLFHQHWQGDVYTQSGREEMYRLTILPILQSGPSGSPEYAVSRAVSFFDTGGLGYDGVEVLQSPFLLSAVRPFTTGDYSRDKRIYQIVSLICFCAATFVLCRLFSASIPIAIAVTGATMLAFKPEFIQLEVLNVNNFQLALLALFLWFERRGGSWSGIAGGIALGLAIGLKPNLLAVPPMIALVWAAERRWWKVVRIAIGLVAGLGIAIVAGVIFVPAANWSHWLEILPGLITYPRHAISGNISLATILAWFLGTDGSRLLVVVGSGMVFIAAIRPLWTSVQSKEQSNFDRTWLAVSAGVLLMLVTARLVWMHYMVLALPALLYFARTNIRRHGTIGVICVLLIFLLPWMGTRELRDKVGPTIAWILAWDFALVVLFAWVLVELWNSAAAATAPNYNGQKYGQDRYIQYQLSHPPELVHSQHPLVESEFSDRLLRPSEKTVLFTRLLDVRRFSLAYKLTTAILLSIAAFVVRFGTAATAPGMDFWRPWLVNRLVEQHWHGNMYSRAGREEIYRLTAEPILKSGPSRSSQYPVAQITSHFDSGGLGYNGVDIVHSPFLLSLIRPFANGGYTSGHHIYLTVSLLCFFCATFLLTRLLSASIPVALVVAGFVLFGFKAEFVELQVLNVNNIQLLLMAAFLWLSLRQESWSEVASGVVLAFALALKPNVLFVLPVLASVWAAEGRWAKVGRLAVGVMLGLGIAIAIGTLVVPAAEWSSWARILPGLAGYHRHAITGNIALASVLTNLSGIDASRPLLGAGALLITAVALRPLWTSARLNRQHHLERTWLAVSAGVLLMLLTARLVWMHYVVLALPALLYFSSINIKRHGLVGALCALLLFLLPWLGTRSLRNRIGPTDSVIIAWDLALALLFVWVVVELWNSARPAASSGSTNERSEKTEIFGGARRASA